MRTVMVCSRVVSRPAGSSLARRDGVTLREVFEAALRNEIARRSETRSFTLRDASVEGRGLQPEFRGGDWAQLRDAGYEGRGA
jgi:hypothetical protein